MHAAQVNSIQQQRQFFGRDLTVCDDRLRLQIRRKLKAALLQTLVVGFTMRPFRARYRNWARYDIAC